MAWVCPVCDYDLPYPPRDYHICPRCMTEFGNDDADYSHQQLREMWLKTKGQTLLHPLSQRDVAERIRVLRALEENDAIR